MSEETAIVEETTQEQKETVTIEQFQKLQKQLEDTIKAQSGSDKRVSELNRLLAEKEKEVSEKEKTVEQKFAERLAALEKENVEAKRMTIREQQKSKAISMLSEKGLKAPKFLERLIGETEEETQTFIADYIETLDLTKQQTNEEFAKKHGRRVVDTKAPDGGTVADYTDEQIKRMSDSEFLKVMDRSKQ